MVQDSLECCIVSASGMVQETLLYLIDMMRRYCLLYRIRRYSYLFASLLRDHYIGVNTRYYEQS
jgi:hypothetical protein